MQKVLTAEGTAEFWSLKDRFIMANDVLDGCAAAGGGCKWCSVWEGWGTDARQQVGGGGGLCGGGDGGRGGLQ
jgi:hypothetical protein